MHQHKKYQLSQKTIKPKTEQEQQCRFHQKIKVSISSNFDIKFLTKSLNLLISPPPKKNSVNDFSQ